MPDRIFLKSDILLPREADYEKWSVIACDQFTAEPGYWREVERTVGDAPSTLRLMLPEAYLPDCDVDAATNHINATMRAYLDQGVFRVVENSYIYVERQLSSGSIRRGMIGVLDLEHYDFAESSSTLIHATEGTVKDRLPPRVKVRREAVLEMPHVIVFIDDPEHTVIDPIIYEEQDPEMLYDFDLMMGGGHITGWRVCGESARNVEKALNNLADPKVLTEKYHNPDRPPILFAVGDGNHSLAAARQCWTAVRQGLSSQERACHPARYSMVELVNIHDSSINFEPIHRVIFSTDTSNYFARAKAFFSGLSGPGSWTHRIRFVTGGEDKTIEIKGMSISDLLAQSEEFVQDYARRYGGQIDYIHDDAAIELGNLKGNAGVILPAMEKRELFPSIISAGAFPRKSFSIGYARDKRYYLESRDLGAPLCSPI